MIIVDTGFWLALIDQKDTYHPRAKQTLKQYNEPPITTWCVITETCYLLLIGNGKEAIAPVSSLISTGILKLDATGVSNLSSEEIEGICS
jgi:predicted nucleic acid-binding protein